MLMDFKKKISFHFTSICNKTRYRFLFHLSDVFNATLVDQLIVIPFEGKYFASRRGMPQDLHQIGYLLR